MVEQPSLPEAIRVTLPPEAQAYNAALEQVVTLLTARLEAVEARLAHNSTNSSRPPSSDLPRMPNPSPRPASGRRPGGQPGQPGRFRALLDPSAVDQILVCVPEQCGGCGAALPRIAGVTDPADERHQVTEAPPLVAVVTEYRLGARRCAGCGVLTRAPKPADVSPPGFGPRLTAIGAMLSGRYRLSKRETAHCLDDLFGVDLAVGSVSALEQTVSAALAPVVDEARLAVQQAAVANLDETGWRQTRQRAWLWRMVPATLTVFHIHRSRGGAVARALLGPAWAGIVGADRGSMYKWLPPEGRQVCWAHLTRDFQKLVDWGPTSRPVGQQLLALEAEVFALWHRFRRGEIDRVTLVHDLVPIQAVPRQVLEDGSTGPTGTAAGVGWELRQVWPALWTFAQIEGVEPTNNAAERALRPAVLWRKGSFGTHSPDGSRFVERRLTVTASCRQQRRPVLDRLTAALIADRGRTPPPSLSHAPAT